MGRFFGTSVKRTDRPRPLGNSPARAVALVVAAALVLVSCTDYKTRLRKSVEPGRASAAGVVPPQPAKEKRSVWSGEKITGWVRLRFDVSEEGETSAIAVVASSDQRLEARAADSLASWPFEPGTRGGAPVPMEDMELVMVFYTDDTTTTAEVIGITLLVIVLVPVMLAMAFLSGDASFKTGN
jgi:hypothetical protein